MKSPSLKILDKIVIAGIPSMNGMGRAVGCVPYFEVYQVKGVTNEFLYHNKDESD